jgi:hypothetical protein
MEGYMTNKTPTPETDAERREFLRRAGKFAAVTPPAVTLMLTATSVPANAKGSGGANNGLGNGDQTAPGGSLPHNGAENNTGGNTTGNPPGSGKFPVVPN